MYKFIKSKKGPGTSGQTLFRLQSKFRKILSLVLYCLTKFDDVIYSCLWVIRKITFANLCKPIHNIINYTTSICPFESGTFEHEGKNCKNKNKKSKNKKSFIDQIKNIFHSFWRAVIWWKNKKLIKNSRHKLKVLSIPYHLRYLTGFWVSHTLNLPGFCRYNYNNITIIVTNVIILEICKSARFVHPGIPPTNQYLFFTIKMS